MESSALGKVASSGNYLQSGRGVQAAGYQIGLGLTCVQWGWSVQRVLPDDCPQGGTLPLQPWLQVGPGRH